MPTKQNIVDYPPGGYRVYPLPHYPNPWNFPYRLPNGGYPDGDGEYPRDIFPTPVVPYQPGLPKQAPSTQELDEKYAKEARLKMVNKLTKACEKLTVELDAMMVEKFEVVTEDDKVGVKLIFGYGVSQELIFWLSGVDALEFFMPKQVTKMTKVSIHEEEDATDAKKQQS